MRAGIRQSVSGILPLLLLVSAAVVLLATCIIEGCTVDHTTRGETTVRFELDAERPVLTSRATISISADSFPGVLPGDLRVTSAFDGPAGVLLTLVRTSTGDVLSTIGPPNGARLGVDWCDTAEPCEIDVTAIVEWLEPEPGTLHAAWTFGAAITYPRSDERCGPPAGARVEAAATEPEPGTHVAGAAIDGEGAVLEATRHVSFELSAGGSGDALAANLAGVTASAELRVEAAPVEGDPARQYLPGAWLRITPDDGRPPVVDGPLAEGFMAAEPGAGVFPVLDGCDRLPCRMGYWVQLLVYDPAGRGTPASMAPVRWSLRAAVAELTPKPKAPARLAISVDDDAPRDQPPPLVAEGVGEPFRIEPGRTQWTLTVAASVGARSLPPGLDDPARHARAFIVLQPMRDPDDQGEIWLADGHWIGDGVSNPIASTSAWGSPSGGEHPEVPGVPLGGCVRSVEPCSATTGLVVRHHESSFAEANASRFTVAWRWRVVGAPPGTTLAVEAVPGVGLEAPGRPAVGLAWFVVVAAFGIVVAVVLTRDILRRRYRRK